MQRCGGGSAWRDWPQAIEECGFNISKPALYDALLGSALKGDKDCGGLLPFNYISGESMTDLSEGRPLFVRCQNANFTLANFMRANLFTALAALRTGMNILFDKEKVQIERLTGHGGFFKSNAGLMAMASAMHTPISALSTAGEGGPWGMALLASFLVNGKEKTLAEYLNTKVFANAKSSTVCASKEDIEGFNKFFSLYCKGLAIEKAAISAIE